MFLETVDSQDVKLKMDYFYCLYVSVGTCMYVFTFEPVFVYVCCGQTHWKTKIEDLNNADSGYNGKLRTDCRNPWKDCEQRSDMKIPAHEIHLNEKLKDRLDAV